MARKELLQKKGGNDIEAMPYQIFQDCRLFQKFCDPIKDVNEAEDLRKMGEVYKAKISPSLS